MVRIIFAGTPDFSLPVLEILLADSDRSAMEIVAVYTQPDRPAGRGRRISTSPVKKAAIAAGLRIEQPKTLKLPAVQKTLLGLGPDLIVVVAYGLLLPKAVLEVPTLACVNVHASLLPRWRGAAPIQRAILAGDERSGVSIMKMSEGLDEGPLYLSRELAIRPDETGASLHRRLAELGATALMAALPSIIDGNTQAQDEAQACYAGKISKSDARLDFSLGAGQLERMVRAFNAWPIAWCRWRRGDTEPEHSLRIWQAKADLPAACGLPPGTVVSASKDGIRIATVAGDLIAERLQLPGRKPQAAADFCNACDLSGLRLY
ncbi:MAG: methionyl-tRNA formyltransferase [Proteobacteria bacterium]|nr:methionyl-tRNA formyltransferase [Pseudomonadota bacterium]